MSTIPRLLRVQVMVTKIPRLEGRTVSIIIIIRLKRGTRLKRRSRLRGRTWIPPSATIIIIIVHHGGQLMVIRKIVLTVIVITILHRTRVLKQIVLNRIWNWMVRTMMTHSLSITGVGRLLATVIILSPSRVTRGPLCRSSLNRRPWRVSGWHIRTRIDFWDIRNIRFMLNDFPLAIDIFSS